MNSFSCLLALALGSLTAQVTSPMAGRASPDLQVCPPGCKFVEEIVHKEVVRHVCKYVPDVKKVRKTVYECKEEPYCLPKCSCGSFSLFGYRVSCWGCGHSAANPECDQCEPVRMRRVLVKREVVQECPTYKCVVETVREVVPVKVYRAVPCNSAPVVLPK